MATCAINVKCFDNTIRPCVRPAKHAGGCNPFSDTDNSPAQETVSSTVHRVPALRESTVPVAASFAGTLGIPAHEYRALQMEQNGKCYRGAVERGETTFTVIERDPTSPKTILFWIMENFDGVTPASKLRDAFEDALCMLFSPVEKRRAD